METSTSQNKAASKKERRGTFTNKCVNINRRCPSTRPPRTARPRSLSAQAGLVGLTARVRRAAWQPWGRRSRETTDCSLLSFAAIVRRSAVVRAARSGRHDIFSACSAAQLGSDAAMSSNCCSCSDMLMHGVPLDSHHAFDSRSPVLIATDVARGLEFV